MKKLYLFGDSFSMIDTTLKEYNQKYLEVNAHYSISNEHIIKLAKLKLIKLIKEGARNCNILIQLTVPNRMMVINSDKLKHSITHPENLSYSYDHLLFSDLDIFEKDMYSTLYPYTSIEKDFAFKNLFVPYQTLIVENNHRKLIKDWQTELELLILLGKSNDINVEFFYYTNDYDVILNKFEAGLHIRFGEYHSLETFLKKNFEYSYFFSKLDKHFNQNGIFWYLKLLKERYDF